MKRSLKWQMIVIFVGLVTCVLLIIYIANNQFLEQFYVYNKVEEFKKISVELEKTLINGSLEDGNTQSKLVQIGEKGNISLGILEVTTNNLVVNNMHDSILLRDKLMRYALSLPAESQQKEIEITENYSITKSLDLSSKMEYLEMVGQFEDGGWFVMRSPIESIRESVKISNMFLAYVGVGAILVSIPLIWFFTKRMTKPILELTAVSRKMTELDFDVKYNSGGVDEIGILGANFNTMSEKLESTISELKNANYELQQDIEQKEKREKIRTEFLGNVSHELKTPIALIQGYAEGLKESINTDEEGREFYCNVIIDESNKMNQMVKNLMALNQVEVGADETIFERFNITDLISGVLQSNDILLQQKDITLNFLPEEPIYVWADQFKVEQVVRNYVSNAVNHVDNEKIIEIKIILNGDKAKVTVFNTGTPIPEEDVERVWDKFYKVDKAHTREYGGNGIGLSIVKAIMGSFKQEYGVKNYDNGVEFWFQLDIK